MADSFARLQKEGQHHTPMELAINNQTDRFNLAIDAILKQKVAKLNFALTKA